MKTQIKNERVAMSYVGGKLMLQNSKLRIVITAAPDKINLALGGKSQSNILVDVDTNS